MRIEYFVETAMAVLVVVTVGEPEPLSLTVLQKAVPSDPVSYLNAT